MLNIRETLPEDYDQKGYVHWKSWQETYTDLMPEQFLARQTLEKCQDIARRWPQNTLVAELDEKIVGYACYILDENGAGEVMALYLLKAVQCIGLGRKLMDATLNQLEGCSPITLWVLKGNDHAIGFYEHYGFRMNGTEKSTPFGTESQMTYQP